MATKLINIIERPVNGTNDRLFYSYLWSECDAAELAFKERCGDARSAGKGGPKYNILLCSPGLQESPPLKHEFLTNSSYAAFERMVDETWKDFFREASAVCPPKEPSTQRELVQEAFHDLEAECDLPGDFLDLGDVIQEVIVETSPLRDLQKVLYKGFPREDVKWAIQVQKAFENLVKSAELVNNFLELDPEDEEEPVCLGTQYLRYLKQCIFVKNSPEEEV